MGNITNYLKEILEARFGKDVRQNIHDSIKQCYDDAISYGNSNMEVSQARGVFKNLNARLDDCDSRVSYVKAQVDGVTSGSPLVANSVSEMEDVSRVYVNTSNGYWYYYNGSNWIPGGLYQSTGIAEGSIDSGYLSNLIKSKVAKFENALSLLINTVREGYFSSTSTTVTFHENNIFTAYDVSVLAGQKLNLKTFLQNSNTVYAVIMMNNNAVVDRMFYGTENEFPLDYTFVVPVGVNRIIINYKNSATNPFELNLEVFVDTKELSTKLKNVEEILYYKDYINKKTDVVMNYGKFYNHNRNTFDNWANGCCTNPISVNPGEKFKISSKIAGDNMAVADFFDVNNNYLLSYPITENKTYSNEIIEIPDNCYYVIFNSKLDQFDYFQISHFEITDVENNIDILKNETNFEIQNLQRRCLKNEKLTDFSWNTFDKAYFAFIIDDCNSFTPVCADVFNSLNVPLSSACIIDKLNTVYTTANNRKIKQVLQDIVANGGEVLAHYTGNLADVGYSDGVHTFLTSDEDWKIRTRVVKQKLEEEGFIVRGLIKADSTQINSNKGEDICRKYFDYSDQMGQSPQFNLGKRKFFIGVDTINAMKTYIDTCCQTPGFYPFCLHGNRSDEPLSNTEDLTTIINYILAKGSNIAEITTYSDVFDNFGTTVLEKRLQALEE